jgi:hypothetical protein
MGDVEDGVYDLAAADYLGCLPIEHPLAPAWINVDDANVIGAQQRAT